MRGARPCLVLFGFLVAGAPGVCGQSPFETSASVRWESNGPLVRVAFTMPTNAFLYADRLAFEFEGEPSPARFTLPERRTVHDKFSGEDKQVYGSGFEASYRPGATNLSGRSLRVRFQGCDDENCYFPEERVFTFLASGTVTGVEVAGPAPESSTNASWKALAEAFEVRAQGSGYLGERAFLALLDQAERPPEEPRAAAGSLRGWGLLVTLALIVVGGVGLNLTPCVLPMIPINLAIIGAGAQAGSKQRGFGLGAAYGGGMAFAYGLLGLLVVLTGSKFGTLNSSAWFNLAIALVFVGLALGMFDVLAIDFSRFQGRHGGPARARGRVVAALLMGGVAALLAGACVAPVVISVLVQATRLYSQGTLAGLFLPFLLGMGMGLPWPFAGAGLSFLPKPGAWMTHVRHGFGVLILLLAGYYGLLAFHLFRSAPSPVTTASASPGPGADGTGSGDELRRALDEARRDGRPVFIDFWASWCKNCSAMEHTTFQAPAVQRRLAAFHPIRLQAERPGQKEIREILDYYGVFGLPSYVVLQRKGPETPQTGPAAQSGVGPGR